MTITALMPVYPRCGVRPVRGEGVYLYGENGEQYLDPHRHASSRHRYPAAWRWAVRSCRPRSTARRRPAPSRSSGRRPQKTPGRRTPPSGRGARRGARRTHPCRADGPAWAAPPPRTATRRAGRRHGWWSWSPLASPGPAACSGPARRGPCGSPSRGRTRPRLRTGCCADGSAWRFRRARGRRGGPARPCAPAHGPRWAGPAPRAAGGPAAPLLRQRARVAPAVPAPSPPGGTRPSPRRTASAVRIARSWASSGCNIAST